MANQCDRCIAWSKQQYWEGKHGNKFHFFKIMLGNFENQLRVPRKFKKEFKGILLNKVKIRGPSGETWTTDLVKKKQDFVFKNGWEVFVKDHSLNYGDFLVFQYSGDSSFDVLIFDKTACERETAYVVTRNPNVSSFNCCCIREATTVLTENAGEAQMNAVQTMDEEEESEKNDAPLHKIATYVKRTSGECSKNKKKRRAKSKNKSVPAISESSDESSSDVEELANEEDQSSVPGEGKKLSESKRIIRLVSSRRKITETETMEALRRANKHKTDGPSCHIVLKPSHVSHGFILTIRKLFVDICLPKMSQQVKLRVPPGKKKWSVQYTYRKQQCTLNKGWAEFVLDNNLEQGDVCVLAQAADTSKETTMILDVYIFRVVQEIVPLIVM